MPKKYPLLLTLVVLTLLTPAFAENPSPKNDKPEKKDQYVRLRRDDKNEPLALETSIVRFNAKGGKYEGAEVDLIGAIHVGDKNYYDQLNTCFKKYEAVLYELVARENANVPQPGATPGSAIGGMQVGMKALLGLEHQLDCIDYRAENLVHADMTPEEFTATMKKRDESFMAMFFRMMGHGIAQQTKDPAGTSDWQLLSAMFAKDRDYRLKRIMAAQFSDLDGSMEAFNGPDGSTIITERNKKAFKVLQRELDAGRKKIAVFYGAGHLSDMESRLIKDFGMVRGETEWLCAWSLERKPKTKTPEKE